MDARSRRALIALFGVALLPCVECARAPRPAAAPPAVAPALPSVSRGPTYRFLPQSRGVPLDDGRVGILEGERIAVATDGAVERARMTGGGNLLGGLPVPQRLGGGFLFWTAGVVYRSHAFLGPLEPLAPIPTNVISVTFGHDSLFIIELAGERRAYGVEPIGRLPLSPHGAIDTAGADDDRTIALDAVGRALASVDGGKQWKDVTHDLGAFVTALHGEAKEVWFELANKQGAWLEPDGSLTQRPLPARPPVDGAAIDAQRLLMRAVQQGIALPGGQALVALGEQVSAVDVDSGKPGGPLRAVAPKGFVCEPLSAEDAGLTVCFGVQGGGVQVVSHVLDAAYRLEKEFPGHPTVSYGEGMLLVGAPCAGGEDRGVVCARRGDTWSQHDARTALAGREVVRWVPRQDGGVAAIVDVTASPGPGAAPALLDVDTGKVTAFDPPIPDLKPRGTGPAPAYGFASRNTLTDWIVGRDGVLLGFDGNRAVQMGRDGKVRLRPFAQIAAYEGTALAYDPDGHLWQTTDHGARWVEVARPPYEAALSRIAECSQVGCLMGGFTNIGTHLRIGWPEDPPGTAASVDAGEASETAAKAEDSPRSASTDVAPSLEAPARPPLPVLECVGRGGSPPKALDLTFAAKKDAASPGSPYVDPPRPAVPARSPDEAPALFGGRVPPAPHDPVPWASVYYHDRFYGPGTGARAGWVGQGLRSLVRFETATKGRGFPVGTLLRSKKPIEVLYTEDFDPARPIERAAGSFAQWPEPGAGADAALGSTYGFDGEVRPVLSTRPGHASGEILIDNSLAFWVGGGKIRPIALDRRSCRPFGGFIDAHDHLLLACEDVAGATAIKDAETGETRFRAQQVFPFLGARHGGSASEPPMPREDFDDADAIAVARDGSLASCGCPRAPNRQRRTIRRGF